MLSKTLRHARGRMNDTTADRFRVEPEMYTAFT